MIEARLKQIVLETLKIEDGQYSEELAAGDVPQWDSLSHLRLLMAVEREFGSTLDVGDSVEIESVADIIDAVRRYREAA